MANGDVIDQFNLANQAYYTRWKAIDAIAATDNGVWFDVRGFKNFSVDVTGITTATVQVMGSNATTKPTNATDGNTIGANITANGISFISNSPMAWLKVKISAWTAGTITVLTTAST